jgi:hypothetical protein
VVESRLGIRTGCVGTTGLFGEATMAEPRDSVGTTEMVGTYKAQEGASG